MIDDGQRRLAVKAFEPHFKVTWESERRVAKTEIYVMLLKPEKSISETFGIENEIPLFMFHYSHLQPRSMQAMEQICAEHPLAGRTDTTVAFFCAPDPKLDDWIASYQSENPESRMVVPFTMHELDASTQDKWKVINKIKDTLFIRNLFDYKLPLRSDRYFYGREDIVANIVDNVKKSQNSAVFGLRKTGKTSVLLKAQRTLKKTGKVKTILIDCKSRPIRGRRGDELAVRLMDMIDKEYSRKPTGLATTIF